MFNEQKFYPVTCTCFHKDNFNIFKSNQTRNTFLFWIFSFYCSEIALAIYLPFSLLLHSTQPSNIPHFIIPQLPEEEEKSSQYLCSCFFQSAIWKIRFVLPCRYFSGKRVYKASFLGTGLLGTHYTNFQKQKYDSVVTQVCIMDGEGIFRKKLNLTVLSVRVVIL